MTPHDRIDPRGPDRPAGLFDGLDAHEADRLLAYLDDALPSSEARETLAWLEARPALLARVEESRRAWALLSRYPDEPVPEAFADAVIARARAESGASGGAQRPALRWLAGGSRARVAIAAAAATLAIGAWAVLRGNEPRTRGEGTVTAALEAVPADLLDEESLASLATLTDEEFDLLLAGDPEDLVQTVTSTPARARGG